MRRLKIHTDLFKIIAQQTESELRQLVQAVLKENYEEVLATPTYIVAKGDVPMALVAHLDTVHPITPRLIVHDKEQNIFWSPEGIGADDRAGVWAILEIIRWGYKPSVIFTHGEEIGGIGANDLAMDLLYGKIPAADWMKRLNFLVELDRGGSRDAVFYNCGNVKFHKWIERFGFKKATGSYSDIMDISPSLDVASVNLSVGYYNEHRRSEYLKVGELEATIEKVLDIIEASTKVSKFGLKEVKVEKFDSEFYAKRDAFRKKDDSYIEHFFYNID